MTDYEKTSLAIQAITASIAAIGFTVACIQLWQAVKTREAEHEWNRRLAAQNAVHELKKSNYRQKVSVGFDFPKQRDTLTRSDLSAKLGSDIDLHNSLLGFIDDYEALARGINQGIYDEGVIREARMNAMLRCETVFLNFIIERQASRPRAWRHFSDVCRRWRTQQNATQSRKLTS